MNTLYIVKIYISNFFTSLSYIHVYIKQYKDQKSSFEVTEMKRFLIGALNLNLHRRRRHTKA